MNRNFKTKILSALLPLLAVVLIIQAKVTAADYSCTVEIPVRTEIDGTSAPKGTETNIILEAVDPSNPMPEFTNMIFTDAEKKSFGPITYTVPEDYQYRIYQEKGNAEHFIYDDTIYTVTVRVTNADDGGLQAVIWAIKDGEENKVDEITFINKYNPPTPEVSTGDTANINEIMSIMGISLLCIVFIYTKKQSFMA